MKPSLPKIKLISGFDVFEHYGVSEYLKGSDIFVLPEYRALSIGKKLVESWELICKQHNLKVASSVFTTQFSNKIADDCGFEENKNTW